MTAFLKIVMGIHTVQDASVMRVLYGKGLTKLLYLAYRILSSHEQVSCICSLDYSLKISDEKFNSIRLMSN